MGSVYAITNTVTGERYIGASSTLPQRWHIHRSTLRAGKHLSPMLQEAWDTYGETTFRFEVLEDGLGREQLLAREQHFLDQRFAERGSHEYNRSGKSGYSRQATSANGRLIRLHVNISPEASRMLDELEALMLMARARSTSIVVEQIIREAYATRKKSQRAS